MKSISRIAGGMIVLLALLFLVVRTPVVAQGPTGAPTPLPASPSSGAAPVACTDVATFVADVSIPDNTALATGQAFNKTWQMRNRGTCTWGPGYTFAFVNGQAMTTEASVPVPATAPIATADLSVPLTTPAVDGIYQGFWQLRGPKGAAFGPRVWVLVRVGNVPAAAPPLAPSASQAPGTAPVPAAAPPLVTTINLDDPARAFRFGSAIPTLPGGKAEWLQFTYDNGGNALPRPLVTVLLLDGVKNGLTFEVYSPERMVDGWSGNPPVGRGTPEQIVNCTTGGVNVGTCMTNNLSYSGGFGLNGLYYVRVVNPTDAAIAPQLVIGGPGVAGCATPNSTTIQLPNAGTPFARLQCETPVGQPIP